MMHKRKVKKGDFLIEKWFSLHVKMTKEELQKFNNQTYLQRTSKNSKTSEQSTENLALCEINMR